MIETYHCSPASEPSREDVPSRRRDDLASEEAPDDGIVGVVSGDSHCNYHSLISHLH
jgi:hypothetical protein